MNAIVAIDILLDPDSKACASAELSRLTLTARTRAWRSWMTLKRSRRTGSSSNQLVNKRLQR